VSSTRLVPQFVEAIPEDLESGVLYVSMPCATAIHKCACGCGREVVTPFSPTDWKLLFDGENVTLEPSIGNWSFPCRSHYWIRGGKVRWAGSMSQNQIDEGRTRDRALKANYYGGDVPSVVAEIAAAEVTATDSPIPSEPKRRGAFGELLRRWTRR
jgi:Family of unknown function (DUF6527)